MKVKEESKKMGITINSYIVAKQLKKSPKHEVIGIPVSYRGENRSLSNRVSVIKLNYKYNTEISFEENAKALHKSITDNLNDPSKKYSIYKSFSLFYYGLVDGALMARYTGYKNKTAEKMVSLLGMTKENKVHLGISNLTKINLKVEYDTFKVQDFECIAASMSTTREVVAICTLGNTMKICFSGVKKMK